MFGRPGAPGYEIGHTNRFLIEFLRPPGPGPGWAHELKHDGYRLADPDCDGRVRLYTRNAADWSKPYPRIVAAASRIKGSAIIDAEAVYLDAKGRAPDMTSPAVLAAQPKSAPEALAKIGSVARAARAEAPPKDKRVTQPIHYQQTSLFDRFSIKGY